MLRPRQSLDNSEKYRGPPGGGEACLVSPSAPIGSFALLKLVANYLIGPF